MGADAHAAAGRAQRRVERRLKNLLLVLHAHLPWGHLADDNDPAAQWLLEACVDCYQPLLEALERVEADGVPYRLTFSVSPPLAAMWSSSLLPARLARFIEAESLAYQNAPLSHAAAAKFHLTRLARPRRDLLDGFRRLKNVELICSTATHGFLPLLTTVPEVARAQVRIAAASGPPGMWLAECGFCDGADAWLLESGVRYCFVDTHAVAAATHQHHRAVRTPAGLCAFARDPEASEQVWSRDLGYPGDRAYLDFHHRLDGCRVLRVPGDAPWDPIAALEKAKEHARHFVAQRAKTAAEVIVAPYDAELFGHWWFEGPDFLEAVLREASGVTLATPTDHLREQPATETIDLPTSSWGRGGYAAVWLDEKNAWMWPHLHRAAETMLTLEPTHLRAWTQAVRELLLAQSSDWPFLIEAGTNAGYAKQRFEDHLLAFRALAAQLKAGFIDEASLARREATNNLFGAIDARVYGSGPWPPR